MSVVERFISKSPLQKYDVADCNEMLEKILTGELSLSLEELERMEKKCSDCARDTGSQMAATISSELNHHFAVSFIERSLRELPKKV